jgi:transposase
MARQVFTKAFKLEAVRLLDAGKQPAAAIARELGIKREKLYAWRTQLRERGPDCESACKKDPVFGVIGVQ